MRRAIFQGGFHAHNVLEAFETCEAEILRFAERLTRSSNSTKSQLDVLCVEYAALVAIHIALQNRAADTLTDSEQNALTAGWVAQTARVAFRIPFSLGWKSLSCETDRLQAPKSALGIVNLTLDPADFFG